MREGGKGERGQVNNGVGLCLRKCICRCLVPTYALISVLYSLVRLRSPSSSLEDNALWMRHLVGLVAQLFGQYAAGHCRADSHARLLSEGSEFITVIWALMSLFGICDHFPVNFPSPDGTTRCSNSP
ncbi:hypothetical protein MLD38_037022 [Melastoma candidum]|uniref:Uncharacterized protein n=1 Tax=Melastoma candidum TaxID=119954 RepID=A0ACB9LLC7_9MYRT|nr:hypothetical protein MLD38_037022 [Melastoma candidum]